MVRMIIANGHNSSNSSAHSSIASLRGSEYNTPNLTANGYTAHALCDGYDSRAHYDNNTANDILSPPRSAIDSMTSGASLSHTQSAPLHGCTCRESCMSILMAARKYVCAECGVAWG